MDGFCLLVELHREWSEPSPCAESFFCTFPCFPLPPWIWNLPISLRNGKTVKSHTNVSPFGQCPSSKSFFFLFFLFLVAVVLPHIDYFDPILHFTFPPYLLLPSDNPSPPCSTLPLVTPRMGLSLSRRAASWPP